MHLRSTAPASTAPWLSWLKRPSSKREIPSSNLGGASTFCFFSGAEMEPDRAGFTVILYKVQTFLESFYEKKIRSSQDSNLESPDP